MSAAELPPVCILAGGLGTRLGALSASVPKSLVEVAGEPFIHHQLRMLSSAGATRVMVCVGHLGELVEQRVGRRWGPIDVGYSWDGPGLDGTLGALRRAAPDLGPRFLVMYGDTYLQVDFGEFHAGWAGSGLPAGMTVLRNSGRWGPSNAELTGKKVTRYDKTAPPGGMAWIDYGLGAFTTEALDQVPAGERDLSALQKHLAAAGRLYGFEVRRRFYEIGTPAALVEADAFLRSGRDPTGKLAPR